MHFTQRVLYSAFHTMHFTWCIFNLAFHTMHFLCSSYYVVHTMHFTICFSHSTFVLLEMHTLRGCIKKITCMMSQYVIRKRCGLFWQWEWLSPMITKLVTFTSNTLLCTTLPWTKFKRALLNCSDQACSKPW